MTSPNKKYRISRAGSLCFALLFLLAFLVAGYQTNRQVSLRKSQIHREIEECQTAQLLKLENFYQNSYLPMQETVIIEGINRFHYPKGLTDSELHKSFQKHLKEVLPWDDRLIKVNLFRPEPMYQNSMKLADLLHSGVERRMLIGRGPKYSRELKELIEITQKFQTGQLAFKGFQKEFYSKYKRLEKKFPRLNIKPEVQSIKVAETPPQITKGDSVFNQFTLGKIQQHLLDYLVFGGDQYMGEITLNASLISILNLFNIKDLVLAPEKFSTVAELKITWQVCCMKKV